MKKFYAEPMTKVMLLNVNTAICSDEIPEESDQGGTVITTTDEPLF